MESTSYLARLRQCWGQGALLCLSAAACIRDEQGRILLARRSDGDNLWGFPGGAVELGEGVAGAVVREVREEIGILVEPVALIGVYSDPEYSFAYPNGDRVQPVTVFLECRTVTGEVRPDHQEVLSTAYFGPEDEWPPMRPCCVAKAKDALIFEGQAFFR